MAKRQLEKPTTDKIKKDVFDLKSFKNNNGLNNIIKKKELTWIPFSQPFHDALKIPGMPRGFFTSFRGFSNTGKSTAMYEAVVGCQRIGDLAVIMDTESNWNWEHARNIGVEYNEIYDPETGAVIDYEGDFIFMSSEDLYQRYKTVDYSNGKVGTKALRKTIVIEDIARFMEDCLDMQEEGILPRDLCFLWDSVGSIDGFKSVMSKASNNQWNAGSLEAAFKSLINHRIPSSQMEGKEYTNTFGVVQKIWLDNENKKIKHKGGEAFFYAPRIIIHYGGIMSHSTSKLDAEVTKNGVKYTYKYGIETRVECEKNQVNGIEEKGKLASTPHGYWNPENLNEYKTLHKDFILSHLTKNYTDYNFNSDDEISLSKTEQTFSEEDLSENIIIKKKNEKTSED